MGNSGLSVRSFAFSLRFHRLNFNLHFCMYMGHDQSWPKIRNQSHLIGPWWLGSEVVSMLDSGAEGPGFNSQPLRCQVTVLGKLVVYTHRVADHQAAKVVAALVIVAGVTAVLTESNGSLPPGL